jgi:ubiquinone/menaquinone biosynthesis C-methylase UbiE
MLPSSVTNVTPEQMESGYLEYRRACYHLILQDAREQGLLDMLSAPCTAEDIVAGWGRGGSPATIGRLLTALARYGAISEEKGSYHVAGDFSEAPIDRDLMALAVGAEQADALLHAKSYGNLVKVARDGVNVVQSEFSSANTKIWDEFLTLPFYEYFRKRAVEEASSACPPGGAVLDAACGLGYGIGELRERIGEGSRIVGADISHDFAALAIERTKELGDVVIARLDLQTGLSLLGPATFDGVMLVGAWHFLSRPADVLSQFARLLRPAGTLAIGYYYTNEQTFDQPLMALRLSLREPVAQSTDPAKLVSSARDCGLERVADFTIGCFGFAAFRKNP